MTKAISRSVPPGGLRATVAVLLLCAILFPGKSGYSQELYVFSEPASNMPARALSLKYAGKFLEGAMSGNPEQRQKLYLSAGLSKKWMVRVGTTVSDMYSYPKTRWESVSLYAKYRFLSRDEVHRHFRAATFFEASHSRNALMYDEISLEGDQSGVSAGLVLTQLLHKLALSGTFSLTEVLNRKRWETGHTDMHPYRSFQYSLSSGYLLFPRTYNSYSQTNLNIYLELLGARNLDRKGGFVDLAPALQLIVNSNTKINAGYRFQLSGNMYRMAERSFLFSVETTFLNALKMK